LSPARIARGAVRRVDCGGREEIGAITYSVLRLLFGAALRLETSSPAMASCLAGVRDATVRYSYPAAHAGVRRGSIDGFGRVLLAPR